MISQITALMRIQLSRILYVILGALIAMTLFTVCGFSLATLYNDYDYFALGSISLMLTIIMLILGLPLALYDEKDQKPLLPAYLQTLPVRSSVLTGSVFLFRLIVLAVVTFLTIGLNVFLNDIPSMEMAQKLGGILVFTIGVISIYAVFQSTVFLLGGFNAPFAYACGVIVGAIATGTYGWAAHNGYIPGLFNIEAYTIPRISAYVMICTLIIASCYAVSCSRINIYRHGTFDGIGIRGLRMFGRNTISHKRFCTPEHAQFWFEMKRMGYMLPLATGILIIGLMIILVPVLDISEGLFLAALYFSLFCFSASAVCIGCIKIVRNYRNKISGVDSFFTTLPISTKGLASSRLKAGAASYLLTYLLLGAYVAVLFILAKTLNQKILVDPGTSFTSESTLNFLKWTFIWTILASWSLLWLDSACIVTFLNLPMISIFIAVAGLVAMFGTEMFGFKEYHYVHLTAILLIVILASILIQALRKKLISIRAILVAIPVWALLLFSLQSIIEKMNTTSRYPIQVQDEYAFWYCSLLLLMFLPIAAVPLAMHWGRHR